MRQKELDFTKNVVDNIRRLRRYKDYSQEYMAICLDISQNAYSKIESGRTSITLKRLHSICNILEISPEQLYADSRITLLK